MACTGRRFRPSHAAPVPLSPEAPSRSALLFCNIPVLDFINTLVYIIFSQLLGLLRLPVDALRASLKGRQDATPTLIMLHAKRLTDLLITHI